MGQALWKREKYDHTAQQDCISTVSFTARQ